ncbi:DNA recombination protein RmuC [Corynebacterium sp. Marseille-P3884]|uniref:DNA recombination protein RmuC n=1 Tax=Corynebacterium sp. Marseille-P3884 TaxID=2495409 RepID=UPI001B3193FB|nr:DNA recombination protein RmuC [Corynebacterium sp. Marseille-P3884]MBP3948044.1 DNA recombination protein RmuC [Corynebacterium sp. Marseille-P3884]
MSTTVAVSLILIVAVLAFAAGVFVGAAFYAVRIQRRTPAHESARSPHPDDVEPSPATRALEAQRQREFDRLGHTMEQLSAQLREMDEDRAVAYSALAGQVQAVTRASSRLGDRTDQLVAALRSPNTRGRWGEMQLERVVELGGMTRHCDFDVQATAMVDGRMVRPDMVIRLSRGRNIVVDAKVPFGAYLDALGTEDPEEKQGYLRRHSHLVRGHVTTLASKGYLEAFSPTPEFVVLFIPADPFLDAALEQDPELLDFAFSRGVVLATPTTLFALLRTVSLGWQHETAAEKAHEIQRLGSQLYTRLGTMAEHYNRLGASLDKAVEAFNATLGSMDSRVMVTARRLKDLNVPAHTSAAPATLNPVSTRTRTALPRTDADPAEEKWG